jgi:prophage regulatory protein
MKQLTPTPLTSDRSVLGSTESIKPVRVLSRANLSERGISYSAVHLLRLEADGKFPRRLYLSPARVAWIESEIDDYLARCIAARD